MSTSVWLVTRMPRALQIKGWWCAHYHMLGYFSTTSAAALWINSDKREGGEEKVTSHDPMPVHARTDVGQKGEPLEPLEQTFHDDQAIVLKKTFSRASCWPPSIHCMCCNQCGATSVTMACQPASAKSWKHRGHKSSLCFQIRHHPKFQGLWDSRGTKVDPTFVFQGILFCRIF